MSRKDYVAIAEALKALREDIGSSLDGCDFIPTIDTHIDIIAGIFAADNKAFDKARFLKACGVTA